MCCRVLHHTNLSTAARHSSGSCESTYSARDVRASMYSSTTPTCRVTRWKGVRWTSAGAGMCVRVCACVCARAWVCEVCVTRKSANDEGDARSRFAHARAHTHTHETIEAKNTHEHTRAHTINTTKTCHTSHRRGQESEGFTCHCKHVANQCVGQSTERPQPTEATSWPPKAVSCWSCPVRVGCRERIPERLLRAFACTCIHAKGAW